MVLDTNSQNIKILTKQLKELCYEMNLLIVEDDETLLLQLNNFLSKFFNKVDTANNGSQGMQKYLNNSYDIIITDLVMPITDGVKLVSEIRKTDKEQVILVLSASVESDKLLSLLMSDINGFLPKPVDIQKILTQLVKTSQEIYDKKLFKYYNEALEEATDELKQKNIELENTIKSLQASKSNSPLGISEVQKDTNKNICSLPTTAKMSAVDFFNAFPFELEKTNEDLEILEDEFNIAMVKSDKNIDTSVLHQFTDIMKRYARTVEMIPQFGSLSYGIQQLAKTFESIEDTKKLLGALPMLTHFFDNLEEWRKSVFYYLNADDIHYMDASLISDAESLQGILDAQNGVQNSSFDELELF